MKDLSLTQRLGGVGKVAAAGLVIGATYLIIRSTYERINEERLQEKSSVQNEMYNPKNYHNRMDGHPICI